MTNDLRCRHASLVHAQIRESLSPESSDLRSERDSQYEIEKLGSVTALSSIEPIRGALTPVSANPSIRDSVSPEFDSRMASQLCGQRPHNLNEPCSARRSAHLEVPVGTAQQRSPASASRRRTRAVGGSAMKFVVPALAGIARCRMNRPSERQGASRRYSEATSITNSPTASALSLTKCPSVSRGMRMVSHVKAQRRKGFGRACFFVPSRLCVSLFRVAEDARLEVRA